MAKYIKLLVTEVQLEAICSMADTISGMMGLGNEFDDEHGRYIKAVDRMLKKHGLKRIYK